MNVYDILTSHWPLLCVVDFSMSYKPSDPAFLSRREVRKSFLFCSMS